MAVFSFAGLSVGPDGIALDPKLPPRWLSLAFRVRGRRRMLNVRIEQARTRIEATLDAGEPMIVFIGGEPYELRRGRAVHETFEAASLT